VLSLIRTGCNHLNGTVSFHRMTLDAAGSIPFLYTAHTSVLNDGLTSNDAASSGAKDRSRIVAVGVTDFNET
jgi:hypothetical protein